MAFGIDTNKMIDRAAEKVGPLLDQALAKATPIIERALGQATTAVQTLDASIDALTAEVAALRSDVNRGVDFQRAILAELRRQRR